MNETRSNSRTKPMREPFKEREINSLKDSEKTNELINYFTYQLNELNIKALIRTKTKNHFIELATSFQWGLDRFAFTILQDTNIRTIFKKLNEYIKK